MKILKGLSTAKHQFIFQMGDIESSESSNLPDQAQIDAVVADYTAKGWIKEDTAQVAVVGAAGSLVKKPNGTWTTNVDKKSFEAVSATVSEASSNRGELMAEVNQTNAIVAPGSLRDLMESVSAPESVVQEGDFASMMDTVDRIHTEAIDVEAITAKDGDSVARILKRANLGNNQIENMVQTYDGDAGKIWPGDKISVVDGQLRIDRA